MKPIKVFTLSHAVISKPSQKVSKDAASELGRAQTIVRWLAQTSTGPRPIISSARWQRLSSDELVAFGVRAVTQ
ncbi:MAG TPA: hypothetical protein VLN44_06095 [Pyrinomonadaceae bacterium]|nr:hypothetical protein [Pyrinomonadaceae bacterium]